MTEQRNNSFFLNINDTLITDGNDWGTVKITGHTFSFSALNSILDKIKALELENTTLTVDSIFLNNINGQRYTMQVDGDNASQITFEEIFVNGGITDINGQNYTVYTNNDTTIHIESNITVVMP